MKKFNNKRYTSLILAEIIFLIIASIYYSYSQKDQYLKKADLPMATFSITSDDLNATDYSIKYTCWFSYYESFKNGIDTNRYKTEYNIIVAVEELGINETYAFDDEAISITLIIDRSKLTDSQKQKFDQIIIDKEIEVSFILLSKYIGTEIGIIDKSITWNI